MADVPLRVISENSASERRITPSWSITTLKAKLEPITGVPPSAQKLSLNASGGSDAIYVEAADEDNTRLSSFPLAPYAELHVSFWLSHFICSSGNPFMDQGISKNTKEAEPSM